MELKKAITANKKPSISPEACQALLASGEWSQYKIVKTFTISSKTVSAIAKGTYSPQRTGPKAKFQQQHIDYILEVAMLNPRLSSEGMARKSVWITFRIENADDVQRKVLSRDEAIIYASDDLTVTTDESDTNEMA